MVLNPTEEKDVTLIGWKSIAEILQVSASTARLWKRELGLPVYRLGGQVRVSSKDLAAWITRIKRK